MVMITPDRVITVEFTAKERKVVLEYLDFIDRNLYQRIVNAPRGVLNLLIEDCDSQRQCIAAETKRINKPKVQKILQGLYNKLSPNPKTRSLAEDISGYDFESIEQANAKIQEIMSARNARPDPEMGGAISEPGFPTYQPLVGG